VSSAKLNQPDILVGNRKKYEYPKSLMECLSSQTYINIKYKYW